MTTEQQDQVWGRLPYYFKEHVLDLYKTVSEIEAGLEADCDEADLLRDLFGVQNLESPAKPKPKFKVGDRVKIAHTGIIAEVHSVRSTISPEYVFIKLPNGKIDEYTIHNLEPYTEPETQPTKEMETKEKESGEKGNNSDNSRLNLFELLHGHEGQSFYSPCYGDVDLIEAQNDRIIISAVANDKKHTLGKRGKHYAGFAECVCMLFPSLELYKQYPLDPLKAWSVWHVEQKQILLSVTLGAMGDGNTMYKMLQFRTPADRDKCIEVIDAFLKQVQQSKSVASLCEEFKAIIEKYSK